jgi:hypothetical protein
MMTKWRSLVMAATFVVALGFGSTAKAGPISYTYAGAPDFQIVHPTVGGNGGVGFVGQSGTGSGASGGALGALLFTAPSNATGAVGTFNNVSYTTGLTVTDSGAPGSPHTFMFGGELNGTLAPGTNTLANTFTTPTSQTFQLGSNTYTVSINQLALPGIGTNGAVTYNVSVSAAVAPVPEPSTLLLSGMGASFLGLFSWRRRRNAKVVA